MPQLYDQAMIKVTPIPAFNDNYIWMLQHSEKSDVYVVDPGDAQPVIAVLQEQQLQLRGILVTHHHADHIGGIDQLVEQYSVPVYGPATDRFPMVDHPVKDNQAVTLWSDVDFQVIEVPGHTLDHIAYFNAESKILFCGDTLFAAGCGRMFEGTADQMQCSLARLAALAPQTSVYCAHEYTLANLNFAQAVEPDNTAISNRIDNATDLRERGYPTIPSSIALERTTNPFVRVMEPSVIAAAKRQNENCQGDAVSVFATLRAWKDTF